MAEHTPWTVTKDREWLNHSCCYEAAITIFVDGKRVTLAETNSVSTADLIVRAVNSHDKLVAALQWMVANPYAHPSHATMIATAALASIKETV